MIWRLVLGGLVGVLGIGALIVSSGGDEATAEQGVVVIDGDTIRLGSGDRVRLIGINAPEEGECGHREATRHLRGLLRGQTVVLRNPSSVDDTDRYDRLLRFVDVRGGQDAGRAQLDAGLAEARYDSRDGYDPHPREDRYHRAEAQAVRRCAEKEEEPERTPDPGAEETVEADPGADKLEAPSRPKVRRPPTEPEQRDVPVVPPTPDPPTPDFVPPAGWTTDDLTPGYSGCRQGYPGGLVDGVYVWKAIDC